MGRLNFTRLGALRLGQVINQAMQDQEPPWKQETLIERLDSVGHSTNISGVSRLVRGGTEKPDASLLMAIADLEFIENPATGQPYTLRELILIGCEALDPSPIAAESTGTYQVDPLPFPSAVREIRRLMGKLTIAQAAKQWDIDPARLEELLTSADPNRAVPNGIEVHRIVQNYPDKLANRLLQHYAEPQKVNGKFK